MKTGDLKNQVEEQEHQQKVGCSPPFCRLCPVPCALCLCLCLCPVPVLVPCAASCRRWTRATGRQTNDLVRAPVPFACGASHFLTPKTRPCKFEFNTSRADGGIPGKHCAEAGAWLTARRGHGSTEDGPGCASHPSNYFCKHKSTALLFCSS